MPLPSGTVLEDIRGVVDHVAEEFVALYSQFSGYLSGEHNEDGTHGAVTVSRIALRDRASFPMAGNTNNAPIGTFDRVFLMPTAAFDLTGIANGVDGQLLWLCNNSGFAVTLKNNSTLSAPGNRLLGANAADVVLRANNGSAFLLKDTALGFWFVVGP